MDNWNSGDQAIIVRRDLITCQHGVKWNGQLNPIGDGPHEVLKVMPASHFAGHGPPCACIGLVFTDGSSALSIRCRKVYPKKEEEFDFRALLKPVKENA